MHTLTTRITRTWTPRRRGRRVVLLAALVAAGIASQVDAAVLCGRRSAATGEIADGATVKVRTACRDSELAVNPADLGVRAQPTTVVRTGSAISTNGTVSTPARCEPGEVATGGGVLSSGSSGGEPVLRSTRPEPETPGATPTSWRVTVANGAGAGSITATPFVVCAAP